MEKSQNAVAMSSKIKFDESEEDSSSSDEEVEIEQELADVTFEELQKARSNGSHAVYLKQNVEKKSSRANKNRPMEVSAKKPVSRFREVIQVPKKVARDPRFESLCGNLDVEGFKTRYNFLYTNDLPAEREDLKKLIRKSNDPEEIAELKNRISWIDKQLKSASAKQLEKEILAEHKTKEKEAAKQGKRPFYLKKRKYGSKGSLKNTRSSRHLVSLNPILRRGGGGMLQKIIGTFHIAVQPTLVKSKTSEITVHYLPLRKRVMLAFPS